MLQGRVQGMSGRPLRERTDELLQLVGISEAADRVVKTYSGGMRRRLDIALGLVHRPRVLFLDEPTTGLDPGGAGRDVGRGVAARGSGVADDPADDALPRGGRPARRPARDRLPGQDRRRGHAGGAEGEPAGRRGAPRALRRAARRGEARPRRGPAREPETRARRAHARGSRCRTAARRCRESSPRSTRPAIGVATVAVSRPSLDDVYLHFTGRDFTSEDRGE